jgi:hypothetical protein
MRIGRLVRALKLRTIIPVKRSDELREKQAESFGVHNPDANLLCASACFFVFVGGVQRAQGYTFGSPLLGIHRPYFSEDDLKKLSVDGTMAQARAARLAITSYLDDMGVKSGYLDRMYSVPKEQVDWISESEFNSDFAGFVPELRQWMDVRAKEVLEHVKATDVASQPPNVHKFQNFLIQTLSNPDSRDAFVLDDLQFSSWKKLFDVSSDAFGPSIFDGAGPQATGTQKAHSFCQK